MTDLGDCEQAVMAAAREERVAHAALEEGVKPGDPHWTESNDEAYQARLSRWRAVARQSSDETRVENVTGWIDGASPSEVRTGDRKSVV